MNLAGFPSICEGRFRRGLILGAASKEAAMLETASKTEIIRSLSDAVRITCIGGKVMMTATLAETGRTQMGDGEKPMTPRQFLDEICEPCVNELNAQPTSLRHAWIAVIALLHFCDYEAAGLTPALVTVREDIRRKFPRFQLVEDLGNANKHFLRSRGPRTGLSAQHSAIGSGAAFSDGTYYSDRTSHSDAPDVVRVEFGDELIDVVHLCNECLRYLKTRV